MAIFTDTDPSDSDSVRLGAQQIRELKEILNNTLGLLYTLSPVDDPEGSAAAVAGGVSQTMIADLAISSGKLAANAVTTAKITDSNVTTAKIADSNVTTAKIADSNVTTAKIADSNVTTAKIAAGTNGQVLVTSGGAATWGSALQATANQSIGSAAEAINLSVAHGLAAVPKYAEWVLVCTDAGGDAGYSQNDEVSIVSNHENNSQVTTWRDATNVGVSFTSGLSLKVYNKSTQALTSISRSKWRAKAYFSL